MIRRIAITGPESTGKSWLSEELANYYGTVYAREFSRRYLESLGRPYQYEDIAAIARGQRQNEILAEPDAVDFLFCDTDPIVTKIWSEYKYGQCDPWILNEIDKNPHDFYLLMNIDLPWEPDPLREHPREREQLLALYINELSVRNLPFALISGFHEARLNNAVNKLGLLLEITNH
jgi:NadR type nicotinamide-nucleotide adenylyltransferase